MADIKIKTITLNKLTKEQYSGATINPNEFYLVTDAPEPLTEAVADTLYAPIELSETVSTLSSMVDTKANSADVYTKAETYSQSEVDSKLSTKLDTSVATATYATKDELNTLEENIPSDVSETNKLVTQSELLSKLSFKQVTVEANNWYIYAVCPKDEITTLYIDGANYFDIRCPEMIVVGLSTKKVSVVTAMAGDDPATTISPSYGTRKYYDTTDGYKLAIYSSSNITFNVYYDPNSNITIYDTPVLPTSEDGYGNSVDLATLPSLSYIDSQYISSINSINLAELYKFGFGIFSNNAQMPSDNRIIVLSFGDGIRTPSGQSSTSNYYSFLAVDKVTEKLYLFVGDESELTRESWKEIPTLEKNVTDTSSTNIIIENVEPNMVYHYGTLDSLTITAADTSDLETIIWFTPSANLTGITIPETLQPMNEFNPITGKLACLSILNGTIVYGSVL